MQTIEMLCAELRNFFVVSVHEGPFTISGGAFLLPDLQNGQYFRIVGSVFNDGVYQYPAADLTDETFDGEIWAMAVPRGFLELVSSVEAYNAKVEELGAVAKGFASESFGGYSYTLATGAPAALVEMQTNITRMKNRWRKI